MSEMSPTNRVRASDEERDYVLNLLQQAHVVGRIDVGELDERQTKALAVKFADEFIPLLEDLPEGQEVIAALRPQITHTNNRTGVTHMVTPMPGQMLQSAAILSGKTILVPYSVTAYNLFSLLGGDTLDLRGAFAPGVVFIVESQSILGGANILIPTGVRVVDESTAVLGGNTINRNAQGDGSNGTLVLRGFSALGGNVVKLG